MFVQIQSKIIKQQRLHASCLFFFGKASAIAVIAFCLQITFAHSCYAMAYLTKSINDSGEWGSKSGSVLIVEPRLHIGSIFNSELVISDISKAMPIRHGALLGAEDSMSTKGYEFKHSEDYGSQEVDDYIRLAWSDLIVYTESSSQRKKKLEPYTVTQSNAAILSDIDYVVFIQLFGQIGAQINAAEQLGASAIGVVATAAMTGTGLFIAPSNQMDFKISIIHRRSGKLIWYREGYGRMSAQSKSHTISLMHDVFNNVPRSSNPVKVSKFKKRRSAVN